MADLELGSDTRTLSVKLTRGADFTTGLRLEVDGTPVPYAPGATLILQFDDGSRTNPQVIDEWPATISGATASWNVDKADVDELIASAARAARLLYADGTADATWAKGGIIRA